MFESCQQVSSHPTMSLDQLEAGLEEIRQSPADGGSLSMIVQRPAVNEREVVATGELDVDVGLVGDSWESRGSRSTPDGSADPAAQLNIMNSRAVALLAQSKERWQLAGDQLIIDLDMSVDNLPPGTRLAIGSAVIEVTEKPHTGCAKFAERFGKDALRFVSTPPAMASGSEALAQESFSRAISALETRLPRSPIRTHPILGRPRPRSPANPLSSLCPLINSLANARLFFSPQMDCQRHCRQGNQHECRDLGKGETEPKLYPHQEHQNDEAIHPRERAQEGPLESELSPENQHCYECEKEREPGEH